MSFSLIVINFLWCRSEATTNYPVDPYTMLVEICFNGGMPNKLFRVRDDVTLKDMNDQLDEII